MGRRWTFGGIREKKSLEWRVGIELIECQNCHWDGGDFWPLITREVCWPFDCWTSLIVVWLILRGSSFHPLYSLILEFWIFTNNDIFIITIPTICTYHPQVSYYYFFLFYFLFLQSFLSSLNYIFTLLVFFL